MRRQLIAGLASAFLIIPAAAMAGSDNNSATAGSKTLTDPRTTGADRSSGTPSPTGAGNTGQTTGAGASGSAQGGTGGGGVGQSSSSGSQTLTDPRTTGAGGSGGTPSPTKGAGGG